MFLLGWKGRNSPVGRNYGVGCPGGVEIVSHSLRDVLQKHAASKLALLKIDFSNAFNSIDREVFMRATCDALPALSRWTNWCYSSPPLLLYEHTRTISSSCGVQQGDPLGPLYFCFGIASLVTEIESLHPLYNKWYMDDGGIVADVETLSKVWSLLETRCPALGLSVNRKKCEWSWLDASCPLLSPLEGVPLVPTDEIFMLGVPLGSKSKNAKFIQNKLFSRLDKVTDRLTGFDDSQSALFLLRISFGIVRATHFMRTTPLADWVEEAARFDLEIRTAAEAILGVTFEDDTSYLQAC